MQASVLDGFAFDPFSFQQDGLTASEVDVGRRQIVDALVVAQVIVVGDEGFDPSLGAGRANSSESSGGLLPPSPPAEKTTARQD